MTAVERVMEYTKLPQEDVASKPGNVPSKSWPQQGVIQFSDVFLRYDKDEKDVLKGVNFTTRRHEKIGIVGRTGAGKSSLLTALFRLAEPRGSIVIDGIEDGILRPEQSGKRQQGRNYSTTFIKVKDVLFQQS